MTLLMALFALALGYLLGSVSFAKLMLRLVAPGESFGTERQQIPESDIVFETDSVSATTTRLKLGTRYGCAVGILDMFKAALPTLALRLYAPEAAYYLVCAAAVVAGHNWPLFNRFKGGRGLSAITGGLLVIDPLGLVVIIALAWPLALVIGHLLVLRWGWMLLMIAWFCFTKGDAPHLAYILAVNAMFWFAMRKELRQYVHYLKQGTTPRQEVVTAYMGAGRALGRFMDRYSLIALLRRRRAR